MCKGKLNIKWYTLISKNSSKNKTAYLASMLSVYSHTPIKIEDKTAESLAGLFLGMYFPENDSRRQQAFLAWGNSAVRLRLNAARYKQGDLIYWKGETIPSGSKKHYEIIEQAIRIKFEQNEEARQALISVHGMELSNKEHNSEGKYKIPPEIFCGILKKLCNEFVQKTNSIFFRQIQFGNYLQNETNKKWQKK